MARLPLENKDLNAILSEIEATRTAIEDCARRLERLESLLKTR